ncbi:MAG: sigma-54-dependent Fis family transcriptional regulator [Planctomycetes bacterium]|nr:sigma-54-dependent Fis family transcriptional regulator [Planctomycetota bacterium]
MDELPPNAAGALILIADDSTHVREDLADLLAAAGHRCIQAATAAQTVNLAAEARPDLVLLDLIFPDSSDLTPLRKLLELPDAPDVLMLSGQSGAVPVIVESIKLGAFDFVPKPYEPAELLNRIARAWEARKVRAERTILLQERDARSGLERLVGSSAPMQRLREALRKLAARDGNVLLCGESGTGKELAARALHVLGPRRARPFVAVNCAAIPESLTESILFGHRKGAFTGATQATPGKFESAGDGTLFLDEIGDMPLRQQAALLRVLENRTFTPVGDTTDRVCRARIVLATNLDLSAAVAAGRLREDLYYRIRVTALELPPLRARLEDLPELCTHLIAELALDIGLPPPALQSEALDLMRRYDWPGNVRELKNALEGSLMLLDAQAAELRIADLPPELLAARDGAGLGLSPAERFEKADLLRALREHRGNQSQVAQALGIHRNTVRARIRYYGITDWSGPASG